MLAFVHWGSNLGAHGVLLLRSVEDSRGGHDEREINIKRRSYCGGAEYYASVGLLSNGAGEERVCAKSYVKFDT